MPVTRMRKFRTGSIEPVGEVTAKFLRSVETVERPVAFQLHIRAVDDVILVLHVAVVAIDRYRPEGVVLRGPCGAARPPSKIV